LNSIRRSEGNRPVGHCLDEHRASLLERAFAGLAHGGENGEDVVPVDAHGVDPVARPPAGDAVAVELLAAGRADREAVVARDEERRRRDRRREEQAGVEVCPSLVSGAYCQLS
jgi:hypothetical protein